MLVWLPCFRSTSHSAGCAQLKWNSLKQAHQQYHIHQAFISFAKYVTLLIQVFVSQDSIPRAFWEAPVAHPTHWQLGSASSQSSSEGYAMVCVQKFKNTPIDWLEELIYVFIPKKTYFKFVGSLVLISRHTGHTRQIPAWCSSQNRHRRLMWSVLTSLAQWTWKPPYRSGTEPWCVTSEHTGLLWKTNFWSLGSSQSVHVTMQRLSS